MMKNKKVALIHDYLCEYGGAERVLEALHELFPEAPVYVSFLDKKRMGIHWQNFKDWDIRETDLTKLPLYKKLYSPYRVMAAHYFKKLDLSKYDLVISSSNAYMAKAVIVPNGKHYCYCHTPPRALYGYTTGSNWQKKWYTRLGGTIINHFMRVVDFQVSQKVDQFIANSEETQRRIRKFYRRDSIVINPPVKVNKDKKIILNNKGDYYLYVNRLTFAKHPEMAVQAAKELKIPLKMVGAGKMEQELKEMAGSSVDFYNSANDKQLKELYSGAKALLYPVEDEDFGMIPVEAMSYGVPVIAHRSGGPMETIIDGKTGVFFDDLSVSGLIKAIKSFEKMDKKKEFNKD